MKVLTYAITLEQPLLATGLEGDPNSNVSYDFVPGSALRGAFISRFLAGQDAARLLDNEQAQRLFFNGATRFLNGYIATNRVIGEWSASLPAPRSWHRPKRVKNPPEPKPLAEEKPQRSEMVYDLALLASDLDEPKGVGPLFIADATGQGVFRLDVKRQVRVHTARNREYGRARSGAVYQYQSLQADQTFIAHILYDDAMAPHKTAADIDLLKTWLQTDWMLGGARSSDYGAARLALLSETQTKDPDWSEVSCWKLPDVPTGIDEDELEDRSSESESFDEDGNPASDAQTLVVTFLSDALLRAPNGAWTTDPAAVGQALGLDAPDNCYMDVRPIGGFNRKWGLPLPQAQAIAMGSTFIFNHVVATKVPAVRGIGERQIEGFGRLAINFNSRQQIEVRELPKPNNVNQVTLDAAAKTLAQQMADRYFQTLLDRNVRQAAQTLAANATCGAVSKSQLYRLRLTIQQQLQRLLAERPSDIAVARATLTQYLNDLPTRRTTQRQFDRARIRDGGASKPLLAWLHEIIKADHFAFSAPAPPSLGRNVAARQDSALVFTHNLRLIDATLDHIAKQRRQEERT